MSFPVTFLEPAYVFLVRRFRSFFCRMTQTTESKPAEFRTDSDGRATHPHLILFALWLKMFSASSQVMIMAPILPRIGHELNIPEVFQGTLVSSYAIIAGICALVMGPVSDKIGRRRVLVIGTGAMALFLFLHIFTYDYYSLLVARGLGGVAGGLLTGVSTAYVGDYFPSEKRGWANGWVMTGVAAGQIMGIPIGTVLADWYGFYAPFVFFAGPMSISFIVTTIAVPQPTVTRMRERLTVGGAVRTYCRMLTTAPTSSATAAYAMMFVSIAFYVIYLFLWLETTFGVQGSDIAKLFLVGGVASVMIGPFAGQFSDRIGRKAVIFWACIGSAILMAATTFVMVSFWIAYPIFFLSMLLMAARMGPFQALMSEIVSDERRGAMMSMSIALGQVAMGIAGGIAGLAYTEYGYLSCTILGAASMLAMGFLVRYGMPETRKGGQST